MRKPIPVDYNDPARYRCKTLPKVGQDIYVDTQLYLSHGRDDFTGGLAQVASVTEEYWPKATAVVHIVERPGHGYFWHLLEAQQEDLQKQFGNRRSYPDPDNSHEFNCDYCD